MVWFKAGGLIGIIQSLACDVVLEAICRKLNHIVSLYRIIISAKRDSLLEIFDGLGRLILCRMKLVKIVSR